MRAVVIGTSGQLARELFRRAGSTPIQLLPARQLDITAEAELLQHLDDQRPDIVLNASGYTEVDRAESEAERAFAVNAAGPATLGRWCASHQALLVHISTDYVFDGQKSTPYLETDATGPLGVYGASKLAGEQAVRAAAPRHLILRTSWVFSAHGHNFVKTMLKLARERDELRVVADQLGRPTAAGDLADAMLTAALQACREPALHGTFHVANAEATSWQQFAAAIVDEQAEFTGRRPQVLPIPTSAYPTPAKRPASSVLDTQAFEETFSLKCRPWRDALREVVRELVAP